MDRSSRRPAAAFLRDRAESTDLFVEGDQILAELLEAVKLGHLLLRLAQRCGIGKALRYRLARDSASEAKLRIMSRVVVFGAVAGRLAAASGHGGNGARSQITQAEELLQELGSLGLQSGEIVRHEGLLFCSASSLYVYIRSASWHKKRKPARCPFHVARPPTTIALTALWDQRNLRDE